MVSTPLSLLLLFLPSILGFPKRVHIGGIFDGNELVQHAFQLSVKNVNKNRHTVEELSNIYLVPEIVNIDNDVYETEKKVCDLMSIGVTGLFGPRDKVTAEHVESICDMMEIPHIEARWDPLKGGDITVNLYPQPETLGTAFYDLINAYEWKTFVIVYEESRGLIHTHKLIDQWNDSKHNVLLFNLGTGSNYRDVFQEIKNSETEDILIDCSYEILDEVLKQAQQVGLLTEKYRIIVTSLDLQTLDLDPYQYSGVNFTGVRLIDPTNDLVASIFNSPNLDWGLSKPSEITVDAALMYDAVQLFARAFKQLKDAIKGDVKQLPCNGTESWEHGISLSNFMRSTEMDGLTGKIKFDTTGLRSTFNLDILRLLNTGLSKVASWNITEGIAIEKTKSNTTVRNEELSLQNRTFIVLISTNPPYGFLKESAAMMTGNDRYEGFTIDIIVELSKSLGFNYTFEEQKDNLYGTYSNATGKWNGMLRKIIDNEADLAITDLTITKKRQEAVDFTTPFMNLGISILFKTSNKAPPSLFSFLLPFSSGVWLYLMGAYVIVSILFFIIGRLSPAEWTNPYPCIEEPETLENQFTLRNSFWFTIGSIMQQGSEIAPIGISTRMMAGCWWFFCLIMVSSYTANLAAFLTVETKMPPFTDVEGLKNSKIKYGAKASGSTIDFFKEASQESFREMYNYMQANAKEVLLSKNEEGSNKVKEGGFAFLMESTSIEYLKERDCELEQVGGLLDEKGYGIAMRKHSPYRNDLNTAILKLQESGKLTELKKVWFTEKRGGGKCHEEGGSSEAAELDLNNVGGVFLVLSVTCALSLFYTSFEFLWEIFITSHKEHVPFKEELMAETKFLMKFGASSKPVRRKKDSSNQSTDESTGGCTPPYGFVPTVITSAHNEED
ncbi:glutamate receptor ionotropic, kainate 2-like [Prorops nasuta]|uniref:glutamate receptor ionotropic, kainate 2-like n=1 Tax=Prorops nasuta TaxID=863751 RepID=UPI0034CD95FF